MDLELARYNMIEQQIRPWDVLDQDILDSLLVVKRELYVPTAFRAMAFSDLEIPLNLDGLTTGETMFSPKVEARLLQALAPEKHETVIEIGTGSGYMAALLAHRARKVLSLELHPELVSFASNNLRENQVENCEVIQRNGAELVADEQIKADVIVVSGAVAAVSDGLLQRLNPGGRLVAIVGQEPVMSAQLFSAGSDGQITHSAKLFETVARPLIGFPLPERFSF